MGQIILASASPRRKELLEQIGLEFEICPEMCIRDRGICPHRKALPEVSSPDNRKPLLL